MASFVTRAVKATHQFSHFSELSEFKEEEIDSGVLEKIPENNELFAGGITIVDAGKLFTQL